MGSKALEEALLAYQLMPGRYALALREPAELFDGMTQVLHVASGKPSLPSDVAPSPLVQQAACSFIRSALLPHGADHYQLLGLARDADTQAIKEHYRLLMRLMHPDFADASGRSPWPADAAARVNRAYEVLASTVQRRDYDDLLDAASEPPAQRQSEPRPAMRAQAPRAGQPAETADPRQRLKRLAGAFGAVGGLALLLLVFAGSPEKEVLVQRAPRAKADAAPVPPSTGTGVPAPSLAAVTVPMMDSPPELASVPAAPPSARVDLQPARQLALTAAEAGRPVHPSPVQARPLHAAPLPIAPAGPMPVTPTPIVRASVTEAMAAAPLVAVQDLRPAPAFVAAPVVPAPPQPGLTLAEAHPVLTRVLQQLETGQGEGMLSLLERDARNTPAAQALVRYYAGLVEGTRPIRIANAQFRAEPREGRLLVTGLVLIQLGDAPPAKELAMQAEFVSRGGAVVMTRLARAGGDKAE